MSAEDLPVAEFACPPAVSAPDGHGMILTGRRVDPEDTTCRVIVADVGP